jgi:hypothetical protein
MTRFSGLKSQLDPKPGPSAPASAPSEPAQAPASAQRAKARDGKKAVVGYFSAELSRAMRLLSVEEGSTVQALLGESIDLLMRERGKHPFGER